MTADDIDILEKNAVPAHHHHLLQLNARDKASSMETSSSSFTSSDDGHKTVVKAKSFGSECFQINPVSKKFSGSEDCLYLNVWTPSLDKKVNFTTLLSLLFVEGIDA